MDVFIFALNAVLPVVLYIALGYILKSVFHMFSDNSLIVLNKFCFRVLLPILLFCNIFFLDSFELLDWNVIIYAVIATIVVFAFGFLYVVYFVKDKKQKGVLLQCFFRSNFAIIGLPIATALCGEGGGSVAAILSVFTIPLYNVLAVISLSVFVKDEQHKHTLKNTCIDIFKNPLILGVLAGLLALGVKTILRNYGYTFDSIKLVNTIYDCLRTLAKMASPLSLIVLGAGFSFSAINQLKQQIITGVVGRIVVVPLVVLTLAYILMPNLQQESFAGLIALFGSPVAVTSAIMAMEMGSDEKLAGQLVVWTTVFSVFTIFLISMIFKMIGVF